MRVDAERGDHVKKAVCVDVFFVSVTAENELELRSGDFLADHVENVVTNDAFGSGEVADAHADDPALGVRQVTALPLLDVFLHLDVLRLPVVGLHLAVKVIGPRIFQGQKIESFGLSSVDDLFGSEGFFSLGLVEDEVAVSNFEAFFHNVWVRVLGLRMKDG